MQTEPNHTEPDRPRESNHTRPRTRFAVANYRRSVAVARVYRCVVAA